jgi:hypothetical protein
LKLAINRVVLGVAVAAVSALSATHAGASVLSFASDADFIAYQNAGGFAKNFGANVRWGDALPVGDWEYAIVNGADVPIGTPANSPWAGTNAHDVTFTFNPAGTSTLTLAGIGSITRSVPGSPSVLFARVKDSASPFSSLTNIAIDLAYNGVGVDYTFSSLLGDPNAEYWGVSDANLAAGFTLTADASLDGPRTAGSDPMYQFKVGIPAPGAAALLGLAGLVATRRRR